jgi:hypothetical protein
MHRIDGEGVIKVADFGLTEDMYNTNYFRRRKSETELDEKVPIRWMAHESIEDSVYSQATDVVSYETLSDGVQGVHANIYTSTDFKWTRRFHILYEVCVHSFEKMMWCFL